METVSFLWVELVQASDWYRLSKNTMDVWIFNLKKYFIPCQKIKRSSVY